MRAGTKPLIPRSDKLYCNTHSRAYTNVSISNCFPKLLSVVPDKTMRQDASTRSFSPKKTTSLCVPNKTDSLKILFVNIVHYHIYAP